MLYPFGYGMSYTSFAYSNARVDRESMPADGSATISVEVGNTGTMAGDEVVQLYVTHPDVVGAPLRALKGVQRVHLDRGQKKTVTFTLSGRELSVVDEAGKHRIVTGRVEAWVGGGQPVARSGLPRSSGAQTRFAITTAAELPD